VASKIVLYPDKALRQKTFSVKSIDKKVQGVIDGIKKALSGSKNGIALASTQVGERARLFVVKKSVFSPVNPEEGEKGDEFLVFLNPKIVDTYGLEKTYSVIVNDKGEQEEFMEGCLSFPDLYGPVKRWLKVQAEWHEPSIKNLKLKIKNSTLEGLPAVVFQHELDHLDGILFIDHLKEEGKGLFRVDEKGEKTEVTREEVNAGRR